MPNKTRVLIADEDEVTRTMLEKEVMKHDAFIIGSYASGKELLRHILEDNPDVVLMDLMFQDLDGISVLKILHQHKKLQHIDVYVLTSFATRNVIRICEHLGVVQYLRKPINFLLGGGGGGGGGGKPPIYVIDTKRIENIMESVFRERLG